MVNRCHKRQAEEIVAPSEPRFGAPGGAINPNMGGPIRAVRHRSGTGIAGMRDCARAYRQREGVHGLGEHDAVGR